MKEVGGYKELFNWILLNSSIRQFAKDKKNPFYGVNMRVPKDHYNHFDHLLAETDKLTGTKKIGSVHLDSITMITLEEIITKYIARVELLCTVSEIIEEELNCRFIDFFELSSYCITQIVGRLLTQRDRVSVRSDFAS